VLVWDVQIANGTGQQIKMQFRAAIFKAGLDIAIRAAPSGYTNSFEGRSTCRPI
jgi:hypothetical protein